MQAWWNVLGQPFTCAAYIFLTFLSQASASSSHIHSSQSTFFAHTKLSLAISSRAFIDSFIFTLSLRLLIPLNRHCRYPRFATSLYRMRYSLATLALAAAAFASPAPQGVTSAIAPVSTSPAGCSSSYAGSFEIETVNATGINKRDLEKRQSNVLTLTLQNGILLDNKGRTGYIAKNSQFQFDSPAQTGAIFTAGWSVCSNGSLAIGGTTIFQQCLSGDFYNLYLENTAPQCSPIYIQVYSTGSGAASQLSDGQPQATPQPLCQLSDGQPQVTSCVPVTQISDGQIQATSARAPVTQISDGQIQGPTSKAAAPVTQISDGQIQAPTSKPVAPVTQISDGQIQAPTSKALVSQISDGQIQAPTAVSGTATRSAVAYTGAAAMPTAGAEMLGLAAGILAVALL